MNFNRLISTVDMHVAGEPLRIITGGVPEIKGRTQIERRAYCMKNLDHLRKLLMLEPRGHHGMYGCIITPPASEDADFGVLFMHNEGWSTMCGHGIIAVVTMLIETGEFEAGGKKREFLIDSPAGIVKAEAHCEGQKVKHVSFENVPSFVFKKDVEIELEGKRFSVDIAFGGAFYAILDSDVLGLKVTNENLPQIQEWGKKIKLYIEDHINVQHPIEKELRDIYGVIFSDKPNTKVADLRNVTIFADKQIDRSPCGTGTSARSATLYERGMLRAGESFAHESITNGVLIGEIMDLTIVAGYEAVIPKVTGTAHMTGIHQFMLDERDYLPEGFLLEV